MEDAEILALYFSRDEVAIGETAAKYGGYCYSIAMHVLENPEDAEESVSDTWFTAWNTIPPQKPSILSAFLGRITRNLSIDRWRQRQSRKRGGEAVSIALEELRECVSGTESLENAAIRRETLQSIQRFLDGLSPVERSLFVRRYWYLDTSQELAEKTGFTRGKIRTQLRRIRLKLEAHLEKEGLK